MEHDLFDELETDAAFIESQVPDSESLTSVTDLIKAQIKVEDEILKIEEVLNQRKAVLYKLSNVLIPDKFTELGIQSFVMEDGSKVEVKKFYTASIKEENKEKCFLWLRENNLDDIIKHEIKVALGKGEDETCKAVRAELDKLNVNYTDKENVHPQTLKAIVKEQIEKMAGKLTEDEKFPEELFGVFIGYQTKIKKRKV